MSNAAQRRLAELLATKEMVVVCGSGGVGKTTVAAAIGAAIAANMGGRVLVLTVDPARRLAAALGLQSGAIGDTSGGEGAVGHAPVRMSDAAFAEVGSRCRGELWVAMLDTKAGWDELVRRHAPSADVRDRILANPLYRNITGRFVHSHDYLAMEQLHDLHLSGEYDVVVIDTPPSRNALDLLDAPGRMREFFGGRLLRWLTVPYRSRLFNVAARPFNQIADRVLGARFLQDIAEFFTLFQTMEEGFLRRADEVERLLGDDGTSFVVVSTLEAAPTREARFLAGALRERGLPLGALVLNRVLPEEVRRPAASRAAGALRSAVDDPELLGRVAAAAGVSAGDAGHVLGALAERFDETTVVAAREKERRRELEQLVPLTLAVPVRPTDVHDLGGLLEIGRGLLGGSR